MIHIQTLQFGELTIQEESLISFKQGLPGFESLTRFTIITPDPELPFSFLQSADDGNIAFVITNPFLFYPEYEFDIPNEDHQHLQLTNDPADVAVWSIVSIQDHIEASTINLLAPLVINNKVSIGKQCILHGSKYTTKHPLSVATKTSAVEVGGDHARIDA